MALTGVAAFFVENSETGISHESPVSQIKGIETLCLFDDCLVCCASNFYDIDACVDIECGNLAV